MPGRKLGRCIFKLFDQRAMALAMKIFDSITEKESYVKVESSPNDLTICFEDASSRKSYEYARIFIEELGEDNVAYTWRQNRFELTDG